MRLLLAEDDIILGEAIQDGLEYNGELVDWFSDGQSAELAITTEEYDCAILDIGLPKQSGLDVLEKMRARGDHTPVLILTAMDEIRDRVKGLDHGADDYMTKPFDIDELAARLRALVRRSKGRTNAVLEHRGVRIFPTARKVEYKGNNVDLSRREYALLVKLVENAGRVYSSNELEDSLYSWDGNIESNAIQVYVHNLRKKLDKKFIRTLRGVGYIVDK